MQVIIDNRVVSYERVGSGPVAVLLHGWADAHTTFAALTAELKDSYTVISLDLAGFGGSQPPAEAWGLAEYAASIKTFLQKINAGHIHLIIGHSNGGAIAAYAAAHNMLQTDRIVLLASAGIRSVGSARKSILKIIAKAGKVGLLAVPKSKRQQIRGKFYKSIGSDLLVAPHMQETFKKVVSQDIQQDAALIDMPVLLVYGSDDKATPPLFGRMLADQIPGSELHILSGASHFVHQQQAAQVADLIRKFDVS